MKVPVQSLICAVLLSLASGSARAQDDGFTPAEAAPTQRVTANDLPEPQRNDSSVPRDWTPLSAAADQSRYASQISPSRPIDQSDLAQSRYATQSPARLTPPNPPVAPQTDAPALRYSSQNSFRQAVPAQSTGLQQDAPPPHYSSQVQSADRAPTRSTTNASYRLGSGDKIRLIVYGEDDLGGAFDVDGSGIVRLPLIGQIQAAGLSVHDFEQTVAARLADGYLRNPRVSAEVTTYRPFYIIGEVNKPGEYPYVNGMNVVNAVALAGGYTYRANHSDVYVRYEGSQREVELPANGKTAINPGDIIRIAERFF